MRSLPVCRHAPTLPALGNAEDLPDRRRLVLRWRAEARLRLRIADSREEIVHSFEGLRQIACRLGFWVGHAPDDSILALRDTSLDEIFAFELETP